VVDVVELVNLPFESETATIVGFRLAVVTLLVAPVRIACFVANPVVRLVESVPIAVLLAATDESRVETSLLREEIEVLMVVTSVFRVEIEVLMLVTSVFRVEIPEVFVATFVVRVLSCV
jgi:hypothetical protein